VKQVNHTNTATARLRGERWMLAASILGSAMAFIDGTVVNVALPVLQQSLGATAAEVQWVVESYALVMAALLLLSGTLGDRIGRRAIFAAGTGTFAAASLACALAPEVEWLIVARAFQGIGGALLVPGSLALIGASIPADRRGRAIGTWSGISAAAAGVGPLFGGWLIQQASWRAIFWVNIPLAAVTLFITLRHVPESRDPNAGRLDLVGAALGTLGLAGLVFGLLEAPRFGFHHPAIVLSLLAGMAMLAAFIWSEARSSAPMLPLDVFRSRTFSGANLLTLLLYAAMSGAMYFLPFALIQVHHYPPAAAGGALMPLIVLITVLSRWSGRLADRYGGRGPLIVGPGLVGVGFGLLAWLATDGSYWTTFFPGIAMLGLGMGITVAPLTTTVLGAIVPERAGLASGINNTVSRTASLLAIAVFGIVVYWRFNQTLSRRLDSLGISDEARRLLMEERSKLAAARVPEGLPANLKSAVRTAIDASFVDGFRLVMALSVLLAVGAAVIAWRWIDRHSEPFTSTDTAPSRPPARSSAADPLH
jgi:EmrB/QacA subfamily drug resistance transporter